MHGPHRDPGSLSVPPLLADDLPPGFRHAPGAEANLADEPRSGARRRDCWRWLPPPDSPAAQPLAVDASVTEFDGRSAALQAVTAAPAVPNGMTVRRLYPPRIGEETAALRADLTEDGTHYVLYRIDVQVGRRLGTIAAAWRWPGGSPAWLYERARRLAGRLVEDA